MFLTVMKFCGLCVKFLCDSLRFQAQERDVVIPILKFLLHNSARNKNHAVTFSNSTSPYS